VAIVTGTGTGVSILDGLKAAEIQDDLHSRLGGVTTGNSGTTTSGGDSFKFEKSSTKFSIGAGIKDVITVDLSDDHLPNLLKEGKFIDDDNDEFDYTQKIEMMNLSVTLWDDTDYKEDTPTLGVRVASGSPILNYILDFSDTPYYSDLPTATLPLLGKDYYILSRTSDNSTITLLDSASTEVLSEGETKTLTVDGTSYEVSVANIVSGSEVKLDVNGEMTNTLDEGQTYKLTDGTYVGIKDILYSSKDTGVSSVEFSLGNGKIELVNNSNIKVNDDTVNDLSVVFTSDSTTAKLSKINVTWTPNDDVFATEDSEITMPTFEAVKLVYAGEYYPAMEEITLKGGGSTSNSYWYLDSFPLKDSNEDIYLLYSDSNSIEGMGKESGKALKTSNSTSMTFDDDDDEYFVLSWSDGNDAESYLMRATSFVLDNSINKTNFEYRNDGSWTVVKDKAQEGDTFSLGNAEITVGAIDKAGKSVAMTISGNNNFNMLYSKEGLQVYLPFISLDNSSSIGLGAINLNETQTGAPAGRNYASYNLTFTEEDKNDNIGIGNTFYAVLDENAAGPEAHVAAISGFTATALEEGSSDKYKSIIYSDLATSYLYDKSGDQYSVDFTYHGGESYAEVFITAPDVTVNSGDSGGVVSAYDGVMVMDTEVSGQSGKNLIIVGGSCINSAAATLVGGAFCGADWTENTGVGPNQFLIKGYADSTLTSKLALLVAGYEEADTANAATYLRTQTVDTSKAYKGTSSTSAEMITEETA
jgi:hypothetical protein